MILIATAYSIYTAIKAFALYSFWSFLLFIPWLIFCNYTGIPGIINLLRTAGYWSKKELILGLLANTFSASILFIALKFANAEEMQSNFLIGGIISAFSMPLYSLVSERIDQIKALDKQTNE